MEQNNQQVSQKPALPIKTRIVAWGLTIIGGTTLMLCILVLGLIAVETNQINQRAEGLVLYFLVPPSVGFLPGLLILFKKRLGWLLAVISLSIATTLTAVIPTFQILLLIVIIPLVLLLQDRKNFWKIAT